MVRNAWSQVSRFQPHRFGFTMFLLLACFAAFSSCSRSKPAIESKALDRGKKLLESHDYSRALLEFKNAIQAMSKDAEPYYEAGLAASGRGDSQDAFKYFNAALRLDPTHAGARLKAAEMMAGSRNPSVVEDAEKRLTEMLPGSSSNPEMLDALALAEARLGKIDEAVDHLEQALAKSPGNLKSSFDLARLKLAQKDTAGAEAVLKKAVEQAPQSTEALLVLAQFYLKVNRVGNGQAQLQRVLGIDPQNGPALYALSTIQVQAGSMDAARKTFARLAALPDKQYKPLQAIFLLKMNQSDAAIAEFEMLYRAEPNNRDTRALLVRAYASTGRIDQARKLLSEALQSNAKDVDALLLRSQLNLQFGQTEGAEADLKQVLHFRPESADAHFALARVYAVNGSTLLRRQELGEALRLDPRLVPARVALAETLLRANQPAAALQWVEGAPAGQRDLLPLVVARIVAKGASGNEVGARQELDRRLATGRLPELVFLDATMKLSQKDYRGAQQSATEALKQDPKNVRALRVLVAACVAQGKEAEAGRSILDAVSQQPGSAPLQQLLGQWMMKRGNSAEARKAFLAAKAADPKLADVGIALADLDFAEGQLDSARQNLSAVLSGDPKNRAVLQRLADVEVKAGNSTAAIQYLQTAVAADPGNVPALNNLAYLIAKTDPNAALKYAEQAAAIAPGDAVIEDTLGFIYYRKGLYNAAIAHLEIAMKRDATPGHRFHLGIAYTKAGDLARGRPLMSGALKLDQKLTETEADWIL